METNSNQSRKTAEKKIRVYPTQVGTQSTGRIRVRCTNQDYDPIPGATVTFNYPGQPNNVINRLTTDNSGLTDVIELPAPPKDYSLEPGSNQPYSLYDININAPNFIAATYSNVQILPDVTSLQNSFLTAAPQPSPTGEVFVIDPHTLYYEYPPKIPESEVKPTAESGEIVLRRVVVPEYIIVHDGPPSDTSAANYYIRFRDYIKNVASSEIYSTWPEASIYANILAILSFTLNRIYTEWYRSQGYNFNITSTTAFDHKWINGRNIYDNIGMLVDSIFVNYLSRPNIRQPILTQYCDGFRTQCPNWMTQWGSKTLADQGMSAIDILRHFYGDSIYINTAVGVSGVPSSWPGHDLNIGATGNDVRTIQSQLNRIAQAYTIIPTVAVNGTYDQNTANAVKAFQKIFDLPQTGVVDRATWYKISFIFVAVSRIAQE